MFGWIKKLFMYGTEVEISEPCEDQIINLKLEENEIASDFFDMQQKDKTKYVFINVLKDLAKAGAAESQDASPLEGQLRAISTLFMKMSYEMLRELSSVDLTYKARFFFKRIEREPNDEDAQTLYNFVVYQITNDLYELPELMEKNKGMKKRFNLEIVTLGGCYSSLLTMCDFIGLKERKERILRTLAEIVPELEVLSRTTEQKEAEQKEERSAEDKIKPILNV